MEDRKIARIKAQKSLPFGLEKSVTVKPHESQVVKMKPIKETEEKFYILEPSEIFENHEQFEVLDGSFYPKHGGYMIVRNTTNEIKRLDKNTVIGQGYEFELEDLPFMTDTRIEIMAMTPKSESVKEQSRKRFLERIKDLDPDLQKVLIKYTHMFLEANPMEFETLNIKDLRLPEKDDIPDSLPPPHRRVYSKEDEDAIATYLEAGLLSGFLKPIDSEYSSPLLVVKRPGSDKRRCCLDARLVNEKLLKPISYPMPTPTEIISKMAKNEIYSTLDARSAFNQIKLSERSQKLVAFSVFIGGRRGTYTTTSMPFGIRSAPQAYQKTIDGVLHKFKRPFSDADSYIDDLNLGSRSDGVRTAKEIHLEDLDRLLSRLSEVGFKLNLDKCEFLKTMVVYCGQEVSKGSYRPSEKHRELIKNLKPFSVKDNTKNALGRYLGVLGYHRKFGGKRYAELEKAIRQTVEKHRKKELTASEADEKIKTLSDEIRSEILKTKLVLPTGTETLYLNTDASKFSWGAVLSIKNKGVISYHGGTFTKPVIDNWSIFSKEILGLLNGLEYSKEFILTAPKVEVSVDNLAAVLSSTTTKPHTKTTDIVNIMRIQQLIGMCHGEINVKHCSGNSNLLADFCSRLIYSDIDKPIGHMAAFDVNGTKEMSENSSEMIYIPTLGLLPAEIELSKDELNDYLTLKLEHEGHHLSLNKTLTLLKERDREANKKLVKRVIEECDRCCHIVKRIAPYSKLSLKPTPYKPYMEISVDFLIADVESSQGHKHLLTTRCEFSRHITATPLKTRGMNVVIETLNNVFNVIGIRPKTLSMDNEFNAETIKTWAKDLGISLHFRCSKNSRSIGVERAHNDIHKHWEKMMFGKNNRKWHLAIGDIIDPLNKSVNCTTGVSPHKAVFGIPAPKINNEIILDKSKEARKREQLYKMIRARTIASKSTYSKNHKWPVLEQGEDVIVKYTNSRYETEKPGKICVRSDELNPRAEVYFENNPAKFKVLGIHKGNIYKRIKPRTPLLKDINDDTKKSNIREIENDCLDKQIVDPPLDFQDKTDSKDIANKSPDTENKTDATIVKENIQPTRTKRTRKVPDRLTY